MSMARILVLYDAHTLLVSGTVKEGGALSESQAG